MPTKASDYAERDWYPGVGGRGAIAVWTLTPVPGIKSKGMRNERKWLTTTHENS